MDRQAPGLEIREDILLAQLHAITSSEKELPLKLQRMKTDTSS